MNDIKKMVEMTKNLHEQTKNQAKENIRIKEYLIKELTILAENIPSYPFYNKFKAIITKTIIDLQYLTE